MADLAIETKALSKTYQGRFQALKEVSLSVPQGTVFGLLGPNGAGKSTLIKTLLSIVRPTSGEAKLLGKDFRSVEARRGIGYLPEGHRFPRYLSGRGVCHYLGRLAGMDKASVRDEADAKLSLVGMSAWADQKITKYSKGMAQRVGLAQALMGNPRLVFLDEPTDGVDPIGRRDIRELIRKIAAQGTTVFVNSHLLQELELMCDHVAIMHQGRLLAQGTVRDVVSKLSGARSSLVVHFDVDPPPADLWVRYAVAGAVVDARRGFMLPVAEESIVSAVVDELRGAGVPIYGIYQQGVNLEEAFISLISAQGPTGAGGARP